MIAIRTTNTKHEIYNIIKLFDKVFSRPLSSRIEDFSEYSEKLKNNSIFIVAESNSNIVGFAAIYANDSISRQAYLAQIAVLKEYHGKKIGKLLLSVCEKTAKENGMTTIKLEVDKINEHAIDFYIQDGFSIVTENDLSCFMVKEL